MLQETIPADDYQVLWRETGEDVIAAGNMLIIGTLQITESNISSLRCGHDLLQ